MSRVIKFDGYRSAVQKCELRPCPVVSPCPVKAALRSAAVSGYSSATEEYTHVEDLHTGNYTIRYRVSRGNAITGGHRIWIGAIVNCNKAESFSTGTKLNNHLLH